MGYKAGMTHVLRDVSRPGSRLDKKESVEAVTIVETPPMIGIGIVGYVETPRGLRALTTVWAEHLSDEAKRRFYRNWYNSKKKAFTKYVVKFYGAEGKAKSKDVDQELERIKSHCQVVRLIAHTQIRKVHLRQKRAHVLEIQVRAADQPLRCRLHVALPHATSHPTPHSPPSLHSAPADQRRQDRR